MAAITTRLLHLRPILRHHHHFSSSSSSSNLSDVKASLQREPPHSSPRRPSTPNSEEELRRKLSAFPSPPRHTAVAASPPGNVVTLHDLYKRNVISDESPTTTSNTGTDLPSLDNIRQSLRKMRVNVNSQNNNKQQQQQFNPMAFSKFKENLRMKSDQNADGGNLPLPPSIFGKERKVGEDGDLGAKRTEFAKAYNVEELGEKLKMLRPDKRKGKWFSLSELNERLVKLREVDQKPNQGKIGDVSFLDLRETLVKLQLAEKEKDKAKTLQRLDVLGHLSGTPSYMMSPPKEELVEKFFHPDNMSSAEKLKLELKKVRDEFKMSESDCGSARVQVAQLTTKIKHLSTVLQKKDKHSRRGLQLMVQKRKKLLKYLRRTDWDSYTLVLSKLGLRDNPDIKA